MRFKKLQLLGFKSFAEPTELTFEPGITAVVGPNGCGKSNVADAIKWVLGEQSARELRGGRMEDLIFNGTERRDPVHYAEVALTLDNSDKSLPIEYSEVTICRRLFRSGESEYLLNGTQVRLKDITELLMGTGIGTSAYSLFEQGRIEQIISARPEDRRAVFEEAAGITKFKAQKREACAKLDETENNLLRVSDVVAEVKRQIQALERQVKRARVYQEQFERLKSLELKVAHHSFRELTTQWQEKEGGLSRLRTEAQQLETQMANQETHLAQARDTVARVDEALSKAREAFLSLIHQQETIQHRLDATSERMTEAVSRGRQIETEVAATHAQAAKLQQQHDELIEQLDQSEGERRAKEEQVLKAQARLEECARLIEEAQARIVKAQEELLEQTGLEVQLKNELHQVRQEATRLEARHHRLQIEIAKVTEERSQMTLQTRALQESLQQAKRALEAVAQERLRCREKFNTAQTVVSDLRQKLNTLEQETAKVGSQLELLNGLLTTHEGYTSGVKALLSALDEERLSREGVAGVLAELIEVNEVNRAAVDAALSSYSQAVVVDSLTVAQNCRRFLEESKAGRVLFLIRDRVPENGAAAHSKSIEGAIPLMERVGITPHLSGLLSLLLADTWLVPDHTAAENLELVHGTRLVTPAGELLACTTALYGTVPSEEGLVVGRRSRLHALQVSLGHLTTRMEEARNSLAAAQQEEELLEQTLAQVEAQFEPASREATQAESARDQAVAQSEKLNQEKLILESEQQELESQLEEVHSRSQNFERQTEDKNRILSQLQAGVEEARGEIAKTQREREEISVGMAAQKAELASFDQVVASRRASFELMVQTLESSKAQVASCQRELEDLETSRQQWHAAQEELRRALQALESDKVNAQALVQKAQADKAASQETAQAQEKEWLTASRRFEELQGQIHGQEMQQAQLNFQREQILNRLSQVYQVNVDENAEESAPAFEEGETPENLQGEITELSQKLQRMGPVNLGSIDEEQELQMRYEHLVTQQNDLTQAKQDLHEAILKINRTTRAMFRETFEAIHKEFQVTFKQLFGGGEARLVLMDEEDILESGIEIIARPPGKPIQAISLLSGGEKALTTIALLFAIFRVKPSPFCLLDEIDAPLDEANVDRFTRALREFLKDSQFIIITHNKKTISMADIMYGITMQEFGVSKIVSVKLRKEEENVQVKAQGNGS